LNLLEEWTRLAFAAAWLLSAAVFAAFGLVSLLFGNATLLGAAWSSVRRAVDVMVKENLDDDFHGGRPRRR